MVGLIFTIGTIIVIVLVIVLIATGQFRLRVEPRQTHDRNAIRNEYTIPAPWGPSTPLAGLDGRCNLYTFISDQAFEPATPRVRDITECTENSMYTCSISQQQCIDDDQILAP